MSGFVELRSADLSVWVSPWGAALARVWARGWDHSLVLGLERAEDYADSPHMIGVVVGPVAGRIGRARVEIGGTVHHMAANAAPHALHSGPDGLQHRRWDVAEASAQSVTLTTSLHDGCCGLPGTRHVSAHYDVKGPAITLTLSAVSDADTIFNAAPHGYWALDDTGGLDRHRLRVRATRITETGPDTVPTGRLVDVTGTDLDFTAPRAPSGHTRLDTCFCPEPPAGMRPVAHLRSDASGLGLDVATDQPGLVVYDAAGMPRLRSPGHTPRIAPRSALALEPMGWPDAPSHPNFPPIALQAGACVQQVSRFTILLP